MTVSSYLFQSPYNQPFQIGRPDPAMEKAQTDETQKQQQQIAVNTQDAANNNNSYERDSMVSKTAVAYATSEGFSASAQQVRQLTDSSLKANQADYVKVYASNA